MAKKEHPDPGRLRSDPRPGPGPRYTRSITRGTGPAEPKLELELDKAAHRSQTRCPPRTEHCKRPSTFDSPEETRRPPPRITCLVLGLGFRGPPACKNIVPFRKQVPFRDPRDLAGDSDRYCVDVSASTSTSTFAAPFGQVGVRLRPRGALLSPGQGRTVVRRRVPYFRPAAQRDKIANLGAVVGRGQADRGRRQEGRHSTSGVAQRPQSLFGCEAEETPDEDCQGLSRRSTSQWDIK